MKIELPMAEMPQKIFQRMVMANCKSLIYSIDQETSSPPIGDLTLEARLATSDGDFVFFARAFKGLNRHDLPQLDVVHENSRIDNGDFTQQRIDLGGQRMTSASLLWRAERFAGIEGVHKHDDVVEFVSGLLLSFQDRDVVIDASKIEPNILIAKNASESGTYLRDFSRSENLRKV